MAKRNKTSRRRFLQSTGIAMGGMAVGVPEVAAKRRGRTGRGGVTGREVNQLLEERDVRVILDGLGNPPLQRGRARKSTIELGRSTLTLVAIPSHVGTLLTSKSDNGINEEFFVFGTPVKKNGRVPPGILKRLPPKYRDLPAAGKGVLRVGPNGQPTLTGVPDESIEEGFEQEVLVDNQHGRVVKTTYDGETTLVRTIAHGPNTGKIQSTAPLSEKEVESVMATKDRVSTQSTSKNDVHSLDAFSIEFIDVVERYEEFETTIGEENGCALLDNYTHKYGSVGIELATYPDAISKGVLTNAVIGALSLLVPGGKIKLLIQYIVGPIVGAIVGIETTKEYTLGLRDHDLFYLFGKTGQIAGAVAFDYHAPVSETIYAGSLLDRHYGDGISVI